MQKLFTYFVLLLLLSLHSCKKPNATGPAKFTGCRISQITEVPADTTNENSQRRIYHFYYNDDGTVQHIYVFIPQNPYSSFYKYFTYGNGFIATRTGYAQQQTTQVADSLMLDAQGRVYRIPRGYYPYYSYSGPEADSFYYNDSGQLYLHVLNNYGTYFSDTLSWQNGDVIRISTSQGAYSSSTRDVYNNTYSDTLYNTGNITASLKDFELYGRAIYTSKHLLRSVYDQNSNGYDTTKTYSYILDAGGRITNMTEDIAGVGVATTQVVYNCE